MYLSPCSLSWLDHRWILVFPAAIRLSCVQRKHCRASQKAWRQKQRQLPRARRVKPTMSLVCQHATRTSWLKCCRHGFESGWSPSYCSWWQDGSKTESKLLLFPVQLVGDAEKPEEFPCMGITELAFCRSGVPVEYLYGWSSSFAVTSIAVTSIAPILCDYATSGARSWLKSATSSSLRCRQLCLWSQTQK